MGAHDTFFQHLLSNRERVEEYLRSTLPKALSTALDWSSLREEPGHFVNAELREKRTDKLFSVRVGTRDALLYLLCEHQSSAKAWMIFRLLVYLVRIVERWRREHPAATRLPVVVPLVIYQGAQPWHQPRRLSELYDLEPVEREGLGDVLLDLGFILDDLGRASEDSLAQRDVGPFMRLSLAVLWAVRHEPGGGFLRVLERFADDLHTAMPPSPADLELLQAMVRYMLETREDPVEVLVEPLTRHLPSEAKENLMTTAERLRQEGRIEGKLEGKLEGRVELMVVLLRGRGLELPADVLQRLSACSSDELDRLVVRAATIAKADDLFLEH